MKLLLDCDSMAFASCYVDSEEIDDVEVAYDKFFTSYSFLCQDLYEKYSIEVDESNTVFFIGNYGNFREFLYPDYKKNRRKHKYPDVLSDLKLAIAERLNGYISMGCESDDTIASYWNIAKDFYGRDELIIASVDKDFKQIPCLFFDYYKDRRELFDISESDAIFNLWVQVLMGDSTDNIKGLKGVGVAEAKKIIGSLNTNYSMMLRVYREYRKRLGEYRGRKEFLINYNLVKLNLNASIPKIDVL